MNKYKLFFGGIVICFFALLIYSFYNTNFDFITYIAGLSSFFVALLTVIYVYTTNEQLKMMNKQLIQMDMEQKQQQQPFPYMNNVIVGIEMPRFFYTPPRNYYSCISRYYVYINIDNLTGEPAILVDMVATIDIPEGNSNIVIETTTKRVDVLSRDYKNNLEVEFLFSGDEKAKLFEALRNKKASKYPKLNIIIYYRNLVGGCFRQINSFYILPNEMDKINDWHIIINTFETKYYEKLNQLRSLKENNEKRNNIFNQIKQDVKLNIKDDAVIKLKTLAISEKFSMDFLNEDEYMQAIEYLNPYGKFIGAQSECDN